MAAGCHQPCTGATNGTCNADGNDEVERSVAQDLVKIRCTLAEWPASKRLHVEGSESLNVLLSLRT